MHQSKNDALKKDLTVSRRRQLDLSSLIGTLASLIAFAVMGWLVQEMMWRPIELREDENAGPDRAIEQPAEPSAPRKATSHARLTA